MFTFTVHQVLVHGLIHCHHCDMAFSSQSYKNAHDKEFHKSFNCQICKQEFNDYKSFVIHKADNHQLLTCNFCPTVTNQHGFDMHHEKTHKMDPIYFPTGKFQVYFETKSDVIAFTQEKMKLRVIKGHS